MNLSILNSILHGNLKPAFVHKVDIKLLASSLKQAKSIKPTSLKMLFQQQAALLQQLGNVVVEKPLALDAPIEPMPFETELPPPQTVHQHFYHLLIANEVALYYNGILTTSRDWNHPIDMEYQVTKSLRDLKVLAQQANEEMNELKEIPDSNSLPGFYPYLILKLQAINLYFSIQETFRPHLSTPISLEDFYTLELFELPENVLPLMPVNIQSKTGGKGKAETENISLGFNGDKQKLNKVLYELCRHINLLDQSQCTLNNLMDFLTSKKVTPGQFKIYLGCETVQFRFVLDCLNTYFSNFSISSIERAETFYSKNGKLLTAQNIYSSRKENPKQWEKIREIINQMQ